MVWDSVLKIKLGNEIIYDKKSICIQNKNNSIKIKNDDKCKTLSMEVLTNARKC